MSGVHFHWNLSDLVSPWISDAASNGALAGESYAASDIAVHGVNLDSRLVAQGDLYLAVSGGTTHGMNFAINAVNQGAVAVMTSLAASQQYYTVVAELQGRGIPLIVIPDLEANSTSIASRFYGEPDNTLSLIAVTGTDGKTSVCQFISQAMSASGEACGYIGTLGWGMQDKLNETALTTPDSVALRRMLATMRDQGAQCVALEASSHGIAEGRLDGLCIDVAVLTNLGRDHLDYHVTIEAYKAAKARLFKWNTLQSVVLNSDDAMGQELLAELAYLDRYAYSSKGIASTSATHDVTASAVSASDQGLAFELNDAHDTGLIKTPLLGRFNVDNLLACYASLRACGVAANDARHALEHVSPVVGRMERLGGLDKPTVVIDYSHTPGALSVAIDAVRVHCKGELWVVFGCGGDRDSGKRAPMARAAEAADHIVVTDDNPRTESSESIIRDVMAGFTNTAGVQVIAERGKAIAHAVQTAQAGDLVLIAGKGHETYQIVGTQTQHFSDRKQAEAVLGVAL